MTDKCTYLSRIVRDAVRRSLLESVQSNNNAKRKKDDEYYTHIEDIDNEFVNGNYGEHFKGKSIYMPCANVGDAFWEYLTSKADEWGMNSVIALLYNPQNRKRPTNRPKSKDNTGRGTIVVYHKGEIKTYPAKDNGDFLGNTSSDIIKNKADIIMTNPKYSESGVAKLIRLCLDMGKKFLILGPYQAWTDKRIKKDVIDGNIWLGQIRNKTIKFMRPNNMPDSEVTISWFTNIGTPKDVSVLDKLSDYDENAQYEFDKTGKIMIINRGYKNIPRGYKGLMAVPPTFIKDYNPNEYEIVSVGDKVTRKNGHDVYHPVIIRRNIKESAYRKNIMESIFYHGTSSKNAKSIERNGGLNADLAIERIGGTTTDGGFSSAQGRNYLTSDPGNALRYALMSDGEDDVHVFAFYTTSDSEDSGFDEDEIGHYLYLYLNGEIDDLGFDKRYLKYLTKEELRGIKDGDFHYYTAAKKIIDRISEEEKSQIYDAKDKNGDFIFRNLTVRGHIIPTKHYTVRRPTQREYNEMMNYKKYGNRIMDNLRDYFFKNRKEV